MTAPKNAKQPQDHQTKSDDEPRPDFTYTAKDGGTVTLPTLDRLKFGIARKLRGQPDDEQMFLLVEELCSKDELAIVDEFEPDEIAAFMEQWAEASGVDTGESEASSSS